MFRLRLASPLPAGRAALRALGRALVSALVALWLLCDASPSEAQRPRIHVVREGDTLARIARRYHAQLAAIRDANHLRGDRLRLGQELIVPREGEDPGALRQGRVAPAGPSREERQATVRANRLGLGRARTAQQLLSHPPERGWVVAAGASGRRMPGTLGLPVRGGRFIRGWGSGTAGYHLAMDIRGPVGAPIRAAERGIVAYAGNEISGYGNFVLIQHPNGWVTAYAHNRDLTVVPGQVVRRGQTVAHLGNTGTSHGPHLHFMLIRDGEHCDPAPLFRPHIGPRTRQLEWRRGRRPPEGVQCLPRSARPHPEYAARRAEARRARQAAATGGDEDEDVGDGDDDMPETDVPDEPAAAPAGDPSPTP
ncbi:MAG: M23 family metallopeptidase [Sandaracinaceae bacterium]|nr:M23 family metallopeptidase [Sandaracinaceae bacterium]